jgi:hypothetical protein
METEKNDGDRRDDEPARVEADDDPVITPELTPPRPAEGDDCTDPGPGRDPRPDLRGA